MNISFFNTYISPAAKRKVAEVLDSGMLSEGQYTHEFEEALKSSFGWENTICLNSGTSALHLALDILDIGEGDEVILPAQTFVASGLAILYCKAKPIFADIHYSDGNIDVESVRKKITSKTKAILCVHWGGYPCDMQGLMDLAAEHKLKVIEDAAHALGAAYRNRPIGNISDITCFSFQAIKHLSTGDGGAICIKDSILFQAALRKKWFGIDRQNTSLSELGEREYNLNEPGYKYHMNNYAAALGLANLGAYHERLKQRKALARFYTTELSSIKGIRLFEYQTERESAYWLFGFHVEQRLDFIRKLKSNGIPASVVHQRIDRNAIFGGLNKDLQQQQAFDQSQIHIPIHDAITQEMATHIINTIKQGW